MSSVLRSASGPPRPVDSGPLRPVDSGPPRPADAGPPRSVELFGPSSGGKSTLGARLSGGRSRIRAQLHGDRVLAHFHLGWLPFALLRTLALDAIAIVQVLATWGAHGDCYRLAAGQALRGEGPRGGFRRLMILRNAWKGVALCLLAGRVARPGELLLLDEGPLQTANYLFVHVDAPPARAALDAYLAVLPLAEAALFVRADEDTLVERTLVRGHPRVPSGSDEATRRFVRHALEVFDRVAVEPRVAERLIHLDQVLGGDETREACA